MKLLEIETIMIHPVFKHSFSIKNHPEGELFHLGEALGCDCILERFIDG